MLAPSSGWMIDEEEDHPKRNFRFQSQILEFEVTAIFREWGC